MPTPSPDLIVRARGLKRVYKSRKALIEAVRGIDIDVRRGEIVGFLGPNGAGKTTTLKMLCTLLEPTGGEAQVAGCDLLTDPEGVRRRIGYVSQSGGTLGDALAGNEVVDHARLYGIPKRTAIERGKALLAALDLEGIWDRKCNALSGGQRRRLDIVMGLIHEPELVFLDEPSTGLDPQSRANLWDHIRKLRDDLGTTVFITTHYMDEADQLADRILIIDHGEIVATGTQEELKKRVSGDAVTLTLADAEKAEVAAGLLGELPGADAPIIEDAVVHLHVPDGGAALPAILRLLDRNAIEIAGVAVKRPTLDDVFLTLTGRSLRDEAA
ncbi:ATP-binding cassette domain-containing protein [Pelagibacterium xiamenense]|uniref:ATP-binding cassette domain-containing protein n=1 Tax=Pelagibacterium xiamenense TaxID=2901140 RepID=UPI001E31BBBC|nr:ATP-binding cassette domain-containing protein [Pelagibacterium xiamenense]MCD7059234.1 ATP-binding cassette domain-containing protein [Pelagibacterium xiamenense]